MRPSTKDNNISQADRNNKGNRQRLSKPCLFLLPNEASGVADLTLAPSQEPRLRYSVKGLMFVGFHFMDLERPCHAAETAYKAQWLESPRGKVALQSAPYRCFAEYNIPRKGYQGADSSKYGMWKENQRSIPLDRPMNLSSLHRQRSREAATAQYPKVQTLSLLSPSNAVAVRLLTWLTF